MKNIASFGSIVLGLISLAGCDQSNSMSDKPKRVVVSTPTADSTGDAETGTVQDVETPTNTSTTTDNTADSPTPPPATPAVFAMTSTAFQNNGKIPILHVAAGAGGSNMSPPFQWSGVPAGTGSFAIQMVDLDNSLVHWVMTGIPATSTKLPAALPAGSNLTAPPEALGASQPSQGGMYRGPNPPNLHRYEFTIYAVKPGMTLTIGTNAAANRTELDGKSLGKSVIIGTFDPAAP